MGSNIQGQLAMDPFQNQFIERLVEIKPNIPQNILDDYNIE